jgi:SnoaL-like domain
MSPTALDKPGSTEDRLRAIEDRLEICNLIASHPAIADSLAMELLLGMFTPDGVLDGGPRGPIKIHERMGTDDPARREVMREAAKMGLAHLSTPPYIKLGKNTAVAFSYTAVTVRDPAAEAIAVPAHGTGQGHRLFLIAGIRWDARRTENSWKLSRRKVVACDGSDAPRELAREVLNAVLVD